MACVASATFELDLPLSARSLRPVLGAEAMDAGPGMGAAHAWSDAKFRALWSKLALVCSMLLSYDQAMFSYDQACGFN